MNDVKFINFTPHAITVTISTMAGSSCISEARSDRSFRTNSTHASLLLALLGLFASQLIGCGKTEPTITGSFNTGGSSAGADASEDAGQDEALVSRDSSVVFDEDTLWRFDLTASDSDVAWLDANIKLEQSIPATLTANGHLIGQVGFHYKGSYGTLYNCLDANGNPICRKIGRKIVFDEYDTTKRFYGLKKLNFNSSVWDDSLLRERLGYGMFRDMNVVAARAAHALLYLNGDYLGVFSMVEEVDGRFTDNRFPGDGNGNLYKECWPTSTDPTYFTACLQTNKETPDVSGMVAFGTAVSSATDATLPGVIAQYNDIDYLMRYLAVDRGIAANDGIMAFWSVSGWIGNHNYYWYQDEKEDRFWLIPWDMYSTYNPLTPLDWVPPWDQPPGDCNAQYASWNVGEYYRAPGCDPFIHGLSLLDRSRYLTAVQQLLDGPFQLASVNDKLDRWSAQIADSVAIDTHGPSSQGFQNAVASLRSSVAMLRQRLQAVHDGVSSTPMGLRLDVSNGFEGVTPISFASGTFGQCNSTSTLTVSCNQTNPLSGSEDARIDFVFRDQSENASDAWQQWAYVNFAFQGWSVDLVKAGITEIHFTARADQNRTVRLDIASPNNSQSNQGICLGWDVPLTAQPTAIVVKLANAAIPSWATTRPNPPHDDPATVFSTATALVYRPQTVGVGASGFFPAGVTDTGFVQIDDISFVSP